MTDCFKICGAQLLDSSNWIPYTRRARFKDSGTQKFAQYLALQIALKEFRSTQKIDLALELMSKI